MKKTFTTILLIFIVAVGFGQTLNKENLNFGYKAGESQSFTVNTCSTCPWYVSWMPEWVTVDIESGEGPGTIMVTTTEDNPSIYESRESFIRIQLTAFYAGLTLNQAAAPEDVSSISGQLSKDITIYPNPSNGLVNIKSETNEISVKVLNHLGQIVTTSKNALNHSMDLPKGIYLIEATDKSGNRSINKVIVE